MKPCAWVLLIGLAATMTAGTAAGYRERPARERLARAAKVLWLARKADGAPVALVFAPMAYKGELWGAELRVFSFSGRPVRALGLTFHFLDKKGAELSRLAYPRQGQPLVAPKAFVTLQIKARMPRHTDQVTVALDHVLFMDGGSWTRPRRPIQ
jgi:hypothetical protein